MLLVVKQIKGEFKIKNYNLQKLCDEAEKQARGLEKVTFTHVNRDQGGLRRADQLVNKALDEAKFRAGR